MSSFKKRLLKEMWDDLKNDQSKQYLLFLLNNSNKSGINKTKLMKELFFISKNVPSLEDDLAFEKDNYGPNSEKVNVLLEEMSQVGLIKSKQGNYKDKKSFKYTIDKYGKKFVDEAEDEIDHELVGDMYKLFEGLTVDETLALTYFNYPEMTEESLVKDEIWGKRERLAFNLYNKHKISASKASEIAGIPLKSFLKKLKEKGNPMELKL